MFCTTNLQSFIALGLFIGVYKNVENFVISHVLYHTSDVRNDKVFKIFIDAY